MILGGIFRNKTTPATLYKLLFCVFCGFISEVFTHETQSNWKFHEKFVNFPQKRTVPLLPSLFHPHSSYPRGNQSHRPIFPHRPWARNERNSNFATSITFLSGIYPKALQCHSDSLVTALHPFPFGSSLTSRLSLR